MQTKTGENSVELGELKEVGKSPATQQQTPPKKNPPAPTPPFEILKPPTKIQKPSATSEFDQTDPIAAYNSGNKHLKLARQATDPLIQEAEYQRALFAYQIAAYQRDHTPAQVALGLLYLDDKFLGRDRDEEAAMSLFESAAKKGDGEGQYYFARCLKEGIGGYHDKALATHYYRLSAAQGYDLAQSELEARRTPIELSDFKGSQAEDHSESTLESSPQPLLASVAAARSEASSESSTTSSSSSSLSSSSQSSTSTSFLDTTAAQPVPPAQPINPTLPDEEESDEEEEASLKDKKKLNLQAAHTGSNQAGKLDTTVIKKLNPEDIKKQYPLKSFGENGDHYFHGVWETDFEKAARYYEAAITQGEMTATILNNLGECYLYSGIESHIGWTAAQLFYEASAKKPPPEDKSRKYADFKDIGHKVLINLGYCHEKDVEVGRLEKFSRLQKARDYYKEAQKSTFTPTYELLYRLGRCYEELELFSSAIKCYENYQSKYVYNNNEKFVKAAYRIGCVYTKDAEKIEKGFRSEKQALHQTPLPEEGIRERKNKTSEIQVLLAAAVKQYVYANESSLYRLGYSHAKSQNALGEYYYRGRGDTGRNLSLAVEYFKTAANLFDPRGQYNYGLCYLDGVGIDGKIHPKNPRRAVKYFTLSAKQGCNEGIARLGKCYENGIGVTKDSKMANSLYSLRLESSGKAAKARQVRELLSDYQPPKPSTQVSSSSSSSSSFFPSTSTSAFSTSSTSVSSGIDAKRTAPPPPPTQEPTTKTPSSS